MNELLYTRFTNDDKKQEKIKYKNKTKSLLFMAVIMSMWIRIFQSTNLFFKFLDFGTQGTNVTTDNDLLSC